ncbi:hypothetical protein JCM10207_005863 [Rhodosporidiobolus poonsookiae]
MHATLALATLALCASSSLAAPTFFDTRSFESAPLDARHLDARDEGAIPSFDTDGSLVGVQLQYFPAFSSPSLGSVWQAGGSLTVTWNTTKPATSYYPNPAPYALVRLGQFDANEGLTGNYLASPEPLGNISFYGGAGSVDLPLPANLTAGPNYFIWAGSTGNTSPRFTIEAAEAAAAPASSSETTTTTRAHTSSSTHAAPASSTTTTSAAAASSSPDTAEEPLKDVASSSSSSSPAATLALAAAPASSSSTPAAAPPTSSTTTLPTAASGNVAAAAQTTLAGNGAGSLALSGGAALFAGVVAVLAL